MTTLMANAARSKRVADGLSTGEQFDAFACWLHSLTQTGLHGSKTVGITSCGRKAGVSTIAENLAIASAQVWDSPVLLMDVSGKSNLRASRLLSSVEPTDASPYESDACDELSARPTIVPNLSILAVAPTGSPVTPQVSSRRVKRVLEDKEMEFGFIILDLPPIDSAVCFDIGGVLGGILLVVEAGRTDREVAACAKMRLQQASANVLGVILNKYSGGTSGQPQRR